MHMDTSYVVVDLDKIRSNFAAIAQKAGTAVMAVIKADAYGHGAVPVARALEGQCAFFGVASMAEALELRRSGIRTPILILGYTPEAAFPEAVRQEIRPAIFTQEAGEALSREAVAQGRTAYFHFAVDTGMSRIGFPVCREAARTCREIAALPGLRAEGLFSHFATADERDLTKAQSQARLFAQFDAWLREEGVEIPLRHLDNSAGIMNFSRHYEMVRAGIVLYGLYPSQETDPAALPIAPALSWYSHVTYVNQLPPGREVSYGGTFVTQRETRVATLPTGYGDGYCRSLSGQFYVLLKGKRAPILGRICMDQLMVDVTDIPDVRPGDRAVLLGSDGSETITVEALAQAAGCFHYEFPCGISRRIPRYYLQEGAVVSQTHYLLD